METVNNITSTATKLIWGDPNTTANGEEPRSGETGDTSIGEPYDKGNEEPTSTSTTNPTTSSTTNTAMSDPISEPKSDLHDTDKTGVTSTLNPTSATSTDKPTEPTSDEHARILETKKEAEEAAKADTSGAGPKPLSEIKTGVIGGDGPQKESHGEGTGEKYVKSSGMKADGGDFSAANPGAGKEADRLLEAKGIHHETSGSTGPSKVDSKENEDNSDSGSPSGGKLKGLKEKIKAKLHKNKD